MGTGESRWWIYGYSLYCPLHYSVVLKMFIIKGVFKKSALISPWGATGEGCQNPSRDLYNLVDVSSLRTQQTMIFEECSFIVRTRVKHPPGYFQTHWTRGSQYSRAQTGQSLVNISLQQECLPAAPPPTAFPCWRDRSSGTAPGFRNQTEMDSSPV